MAPVVEADDASSHAFECCISDPSRLRAATGWEAHTPLSVTLRDLLDHWRERVGAVPAPGPG